MKGLKMAEKKKPLTVGQLEAMRIRYADPDVPLRQIGAEFNVSEAAVRKHALKNKWIRSMVEPIRKRAEQILQKAVVRGEKLSAPKEEDPIEVHAAVALQEMDERDSRALNQATVDNVVTHDEMIELNAIAQAVIINHERQDIRRARLVSNLMLEELFAVTGRPMELKDLIKAVSDKEGDEGTTADALRRVTSLPSRINAMAQVAMTMEKLIKLERVVHKIDDPENTKGSALEDLLYAIGTR